MLQVQEATTKLNSLMKQEENVLFNFHFSITLSFLNYSLNRSSNDFKNRSAEKEMPTITFPTNNMQNKSLNDEISSVEIH